MINAEDAIRLGQVGQPVQLTNLKSFSLGWLLMSHSSQNSFSAADFWDVNTFYMYPKKFHLGRFGPTPQSVKN